MISSVLLDISLLFSCCCYSFLFSFFYHFRSSILFSYSSVFFFVFFLHILLHFCCFSFNPVFLISFAWYKFIITMLFLFLCKFLNFYLFFFSILFLFISFSFFLSSSFFFSLLFFLFPFFFLPFSSYPSEMISSIFLVISWERCSPLPHFIHPCAL